MTMQEDSLQARVSELESHLPRLALERDSVPIANDCYEAAWYWCDLGRWVLERNTRVNYPERVRGEWRLLAQLQDILLSKSPEDQQKYAPVLALGGGILKIVEKVQPPKDGHLGFLRIARTEFAFVQTDFGFSIVDEQPTSIRFSSDAVYLELRHSINPWLACAFGPEVSERRDFWIADLLYLNHDERYRTLPERLDMKTEAAVGDWLKFLARIFKQYGSPVFGNSPGTFAALDQAQAERDAVYAREMELKYLNNSD